jgi:uncharacterized alkaline shock family protein YloU
VTLTTAADGSLAAAAAEIAAAATGLPTVARLYHGVVGEIATYGGGRRVGGVRIHPDSPPRVDVHVVACYGPPLPEIANAVRMAIGERLQGSRPELADAVINVHIADMEDPQVPT